MSFRSPVSCRKSFLTLISAETAHWVRGSQSPNPWHWDKNFHHLGLFEYVGWRGLTTWLTFSRKCKISCDIYIKFAFLIQCLPSLKKTDWWRTSKIMWRFRPSRVAKCSLIYYIFNISANNVTEITRIKKKRSLPLIFLYYMMKRKGLCIARLRKNRVPWKNIVNHWFL